MNNARIVKTSKLVNGINIGLKKYYSAKVSIEEYALSKIAVDSNDSEAFSNKYKPPANIALRPERAAVPDTNFANQIRGSNDEISKLCTLYVGSKSTQVIKRDKSMTPTTNQLEEISADLWDPHNLPS